LGRAAHSWRVFFVLIHVSAALYHHFIRGVDAAARHGRVLTRWVVNTKPGRSTETPIKPVILPQTEQGLGMAKRINRRSARRHEMG
jgi:hypothetical protein